MDHIDDYIAAGWCVQPLPPGSDHPAFEDWQTRPASPPEAFTPGTGFALLLGRSGLLDVDLDCPEAVIAARHLLPTTATFGRPGKEATHAIYTGESGYMKLDDPGVAKGERACVVELRSGRRYTAGPGTVHWKDGGLVAWTPGHTAATVASVDGAELRQCVSAIGVAVIVARAFQAGERHEIALALGGAMASNDWPAERALAVLAAVCELARGDLSKHAPGLESTYARHAAGDHVTGLGKLRELVGDARGAALRGMIERRDPRPSIIVGVDDVVHLERASKALRDRAPYLFYAGTRLVEVNGGRSYDVSCDEADSLLTHEMRWLRPGKEAPVPTRPPVQVARLLSRGLGDLPKLAGIRSSPLVRPDGTVHGEPGYDEQSGWWLDCDRDLSDRIGTTRADADAAASRLLGAVADAAWQADDDAVAWLAHVLTVAGRPLIAGSVPVWVYSATQQGSGKTTLAKLASWIPSGKEPPLSECKLDDLPRFIGPAAAEPGIVVDNVPDGTTIRSPWLESAITSGEARYDMKFEHACTRPLCAVVAITSNGARTGADMARRTVPVRLNVGPRHRFRSADLLGDLQPRREQLAIDALTLLRAWILAGRPSGNASVLTSFGAWSRVIGGVLAWLELGDVPMAIQEQQRGLNADAEAVCELVEAFAAWLDATGRSSARSRDVVDGAPRYGEPAETDAQRAQAALLSVIASIRNVPTARVDAGAVGLVFGRMMAWTPYGRITSKPGHGGKLIWSIEGAPAEADGAA